LRHLPPSPDTVWSSDDLARLVEYVQQEQRWPEELMPARPSLAQAWEPPWRNGHALFSKPSPEWRQPSLAQAGSSGRRAFSAAHARPIRASHCHVATKIEKRSSLKIHRDGSKHEHKEVPADRFADAASQTAVDVVNEEVSQSIPISRESPLQRTVADRTPCISDTVLLRPESKDADLRGQRGVAEIANAFLSSDLRDAFRESSPCSLKSHRPPDASEWHSAEEHHKATSLQIDANRLPPALDGCGQLHQPRLARGGWAVEVPMRSMPSPVCTERSERAARLEVTPSRRDRGEPSSLEHGLSSSSIASSSSSNSSRLGLGAPWVYSAGAFSETL